jgi:hypothetical protein
MLNRQASPTLKMASIHQLPGLCCWSKLLGSAPLTKARLQSEIAKPNNVCSAGALLLLLLLRQPEASGCSTTHIKTGSAHHYMCYVRPPTAQLDFCVCSQAALQVKASLISSAVMPTSSAAAKADDSRSITLLRGDAAKFLDGHEVNDYAT